MEEKNKQANGSNTEYTNTAIRHEAGPDLLRHEAGSDLLRPDSKALGGIHWGAGRAPRKLYKRKHRIIIKYTSNGNKPTRKYFHTFTLIYFDEVINQAINKK